MPHRKINLLSNASSTSQSLWRQYLLLGIMLSLFLLLGMRVVHLQIVENERLQTQGDARYLRELTVLPERGRILDRNGQVLTVSTPVDSLWAEPAVFCAAQEQWQPMLDHLTVTQKRLRTQCEKQKNSDFMYIQRRLPPMLAKQIMQLEVPGVEKQQEYKRYYPGGPAGAHLLGFTNVDDVGQEGLERAYETQLSGTPGRILVLKDHAGNYVESVENIQQVQHGTELIISIDQRIQALASDYLEAAVQQHKATSGTVVVLSIPSGEILAMVNSPQFNPNDRSTMTADKFRNRGVTDIFEPGSTVKPFTVAMAIQNDHLQADTIIDTSPGYYQIGDHTIRDVHNYGAISVFDVIVRSSNVGITKIALALPYDELFDTFASLGFGSRSANLPGEIPGKLKRRSHRLDHAALSYGYGFSVTPLQLARAYSVFATDGVLLPVTLQRKPPGYHAPGVRLFDSATTFTVRAMLEKAASAAGTAQKARIPRYRVGGKTGTSHKLFNKKYHSGRYLSTFVGLAPITNPKFVIVVTVDDPRGKFYYGGDVAAPVFANLMSDLLRLYNVEPDAVPPTQTASNTTGNEI